MGRRQVLVGGAALVVVGAVGGFGLVETGVVPGKRVFDVAFGACGDQAPTPVSSSGPLVSGSFVSTACSGIEVGWTVAYPPGVSASAKLPVCVALHGRGGDHSWPFAGLDLQYFLADAVTDRGVPAFALAAVDGGDKTNWHRRQSGDDPLAMITDELLPLLAARGLSTVRIGLWGWSLGGYGALLLASALGSQRVAAVVATSPALWETFGATGPGTFDDEADFTANSVSSRLAQLERLPLRIDCGRDDPFAMPVRRLRAAVQPTPAGGLSAGCHDEAFWTRSAAPEIDFLGQHLGVDAS